MVHPIVDTHRNLLAQAQELMKNADLTPHKLTAKTAPFVGGDFDVKDSWESVVYPLMNQHGVHVEVKLRFEIRDSANITVGASASAWHQSAKFGAFPVHSGSTRSTDETLYHHQLGENGLSDLLNEALEVAALIEPADVTGESWANVVIPDPADAEEEEDD